MLAVDCCVSPDGSLIVACHSGPPDWGTGPTGQGRVFKIKYTGRDLPQPVLAWAAGADEFRVAFDRPLTPPIGPARDKKRASKQGLMSALATVLKCFGLVTRSFATNWPRHAVGWTSWAYAK